MLFEKVLTKNDVGATNSHQSGFLIPKSMSSLLSFLPSLDPKILNPSIILPVYDDRDEIWEFRYIYYNNKLHSKGGTRNEYRITRTTKFMKKQKAKEGDLIRFTKNKKGHYMIVVVSSIAAHPQEGNKVRLKGWNQVF